MRWLRAILRGVTFLHRCVSVTAAQGLVLRPDLASVLDPPQPGPPVAAAGGGACGLAASAGGPAAG